MLLRCISFVPPAIAMNRLVRNALVARAPGDDGDHHPEEEAEKWDLKVADKEGNSIEWNDLNLLKIEKVTLHYNDGKATAEVE